MANKALGIQCHLELLCKGDLRQIVDLALRSEKGKSKIQRFDYLAF